MPVNATTGTPFDPYEGQGSSQASSFAHAVQQPINQNLGVALQSAVPDYSTQTLSYNQSRAQLDFQYQILSRQLDYSNSYYNGRITQARNGRDWGAFHQIIAAAGDEYARIKSSINNNTETMLENSVNHYDGLMNQAMSIHDWDSVMRISAEAAKDYYGISNSRISDSRLS